MIPINLSPDCKTLVEFAYRGFTILGLDRRPDDLLPRSAVAGDGH